ncbi:MAG: hypothetical protein BWY47_01930 [Bacteroidetes bacterium ADurb.Bin302]|nr:MAG: hypothetical protein BWY47_01930 [Bacteroidetes bacterium ADurb.Bin302]
MTNAENNKNFLRHVALGLFDKIKNRIAKFAEDVKVNPPIVPYEIHERNCFSDLDYYHSLSLVLIKTAIQMDEKKVMIEYINMLYKNNLNKAFKKGLVKYVRYHHIDPYFLMTPKEKKKQMAIEKEANKLGLKMVEEIMEEIKSKQENL